MADMVDSDSLGVVSLPQKGDKVSVLQDAGECTVVEDHC